MNQTFRGAALVCQLLIATVVATLTNETHAAPAIPIPGGGGATYPPTSLAVEMVSLPLEHKTNTNNVAIAAVSVSATISTEDIGLKRIRVVFAEDASTNLLRNLRVFDQFGIVVSPTIQQVTKIGGKCVADFSVGYNNQQYDIEIIKVYPSYEFYIRADIANDTLVTNGIVLHASLDPLRPVSAQGLDSGRVASIFYQPTSVAHISIAQTYPKTGHINTITRSGQNVVLSGTLSQTGAYVFEKSATAISPVWSTIQSGTAVTTTVSLTTVAPVSGNMFYRLRLL